MYHVSLENIRDEINPNDFFENMSYVKKIHEELKDIEEDTYDPEQDLEELPKELEKF